MGLVGARDAFGAWARSIQLPQEQAPRGETVIIIALTLLLGWILSENKNQSKACL